jgi:hypothetical protein
MTDRDVLVAHRVRRSFGLPRRMPASGVLGDRDDARVQGSVVVGLFEQAVADHQCDLRLQIQRRVEWFVVEHFLDERGDQYVLVPGGQGGQGLGPVQDVVADASGEVLVHLAGASQQVGQQLIAVFDHAVGVGVGHLLRPVRGSGA